jgi:hypothetical protein
VNVASDPDESEKTLRAVGRTKVPPDGRTVPLAALPATLRKLLEETPRKEWYQIKAIRASFSETTELALILNALEYLRKVTPDKLLDRVMDGKVEERSFYAAYREIRDQIRILREKCDTLATLSQVEVKAWSDGRGRKRKDVPPAPGGPPEKLRKVS